MTEWETDGDDTSEPGVINRETLVERLAVVRHASARADTFVGHPVRGFARNARSVGIWWRRRCSPRPRRSRPPIGS